MSLFKLTDGLYWQCDMFIWLHLYPWGHSGSPPWFIQWRHNYSYISGVYFGFSFHHRTNARELIKMQSDFLASDNKFPEGDMCIFSCFLVMPRLWDWNNWNMIKKWNNKKEVKWMKNKNRKWIWKNRKVILKIK